MSEKPKYTLQRNSEMPKFNRSLSLVCWAYNEEVLIGRYLERIHRLLNEVSMDFEIIVVDDGSTDRTADIVRRLQKKFPKLLFYQNERNMNVGYSSQRAIRLASKDYVFWQTIDWSYNITMLRTFLELLNTHTVVAGVRRAPVSAANRYIRPIKGILALMGIKHLTRRSDTLYKAIVSVVNYTLIRALFRIPVSDYQNVVIYPRPMVQSFRFESNSSFANPELLIKAFWSGARIVEVPISFIPRSEGTAKGTRVHAILRSVSDILRLWYRWNVLGELEKKRMGVVSRLIPEEWEVL